MITDLERANADHSAICNELNCLFRVKNAAYGDSFHKSYADEGMAMPRIRIGDKFNRFCNMTRNCEIAENGESIRDTLMDMANYCIMTVMEMDKG